MVSLFQLLLIITVVVLFFKYLEPVLLFIRKKRIEYFQKVKIRNQTRLYEERGYTLALLGYTIIAKTVHGDFIFIKKGYYTFSEDELRGFSNKQFNQKINEKITKK